VAASTIQLSTKMKRRLNEMKLHPRETYEEVLERLLEDLQELSVETKRDIDEAIREIQAGRFRTHEQLGDEMGFWCPSKYSGPSQLPNNWGVWTGR
jgi:predicted transcriptional regulator